MYGEGEGEKSGASDAKASQGAESFATVGDESRGPGTGKIDCSSPFHRSEHAIGFMHPLVFLAPLDKFNLNNIRYTENTAVKLEGRWDMTRPQLALVHNVEVVSTPISFSQLLADHHAIVQGYLDTHITRNHSDYTIESERRFLVGWFESFMMPDNSHPDGERQLFVWEAMVPVLGRQRIIGFSKGLVDAGLKPRTVQGYLGFLRRLFQYVLEFPYIPGTEVQSIVSKYGRLEQPVLEYDYPVHVLDQEEEGFVLTGEQLLRFYDFVRLEYIGHNQKKLPASRDYTMIVVAGESGLRAEKSGIWMPADRIVTSFTSRTVSKPGMGRAPRARANGSARRSSPPLPKRPCASMKSASARTSPMRRPTPHFS